MRRLLIWAGIAAGVVAGGLLPDVAGLPSSYLFAALLVGLAIALAPAGGDWRSTPPAFRGAQAVVGVSLGAYLEADALRRAGRLVAPGRARRARDARLSLLCGAMLARTAGLDPPTAALGMIAGGASGIVGMARRARRRRPARRVHAVPARARRRAAHAASASRSPSVASTPEPRRPAGAGTFGEPPAWLVTAALAGVGAGRGAARAVPAGALLVPMLLTGVFVLRAVPTTSCSRRC